jgi:hypothetical protein
LFGLPAAVTLTLCIIMAVLTVISGIQYFAASRHVFAFKAQDQQAP